MYEEKLIRVIKGGTAAINRLEKSPAAAGLGKSLNALAKINPGMAEELMNNYKAACEKYKNAKGE
jgi:hypothetical protein